MSSSKTKDTLTFRIDAKSRKQLDKIASNTDRNRSVIITEAIRSYLEYHEWAAGHIEKGIEQARKRNFASDAEVTRAFKR